MAAHALRGSRLKLEIIGRFPNISAAYDGRIGTGVLLAGEVDEPLSTQAGDFVDLALNALLDPAALRELRETVVG